MKRLSVVLPLLLAACGPSAEVPQPVEANGQAVRETINMLTARYGECVLGAAKSIDNRGKMATVLADEAFASCRPMRDELTAEVLKFRRIGHPSEPEANSKLTADQSVLNLDADLREQVLVIATTRNLGSETGNNAENL